MSGGLSFVFFIQRMKLFVLKEHLDDFFFTFLLMYLHAV